MHFWGRDCPSGPGAELAAEVIAEAGIEPHWEVSVATRRRERDVVAEASFATRQLCLPPDRRAEVAELLAGIERPRDRITLWWDSGDAGSGPSTAG